MKVLMFGWEFPPFNKGGLGTACYGLSKALSQKDVEITFVVPRTPKLATAKYVNLISAANLSKIEIKNFNSPLSAYMTAEEYQKEILKYSQSPTEQVELYGKNIFEEVERYAKQASLIADFHDHDIIHAHDWMSVKAGMAARNISGKPLIMHVHATEFDRSGNNGVHQYVYDIERKGMHSADEIIAVSNFTKNKLVEHYGVHSEKITVIHNAVDFNENKFTKYDFPIKENNKIVLFLGRLTLQKGPDWFLQTAKKVLDYQNNITFIMAGSGDMQAALIERAAQLGISDNFLFTGFLRGRDVDRAYQMADLYVMPSVSEPFGITPLESMRNNVPAIISNQSGVTEVLNHCLKVDFWDVDETANKIISALNYPELYDCLQRNAVNEIKTFSWHEPAKKCIELYNKFITCEVLS